MKLKTSRRVGKLDDQALKTVENGRYARARDFLLSIIKLALTKDFGVHIVDQPQ